MSVEPEYAEHYLRKHAAQMIGVSERVMAGAISRGDINATRFGNRILVPGSEVKRIVEALNGSATAKTTTTVLPSINTDQLESAADAMMVIAAGIAEFSRLLRNLAKERKA
jgi:hypothetical protein